MSWKSTPEDSNSVLVVVKDLLPQMHMDIGEYKAAKVCISDQNDGYARGTIFSEPSVSQPPAVPSSDGRTVVVSAVTFTTSSDYGLAYRAATRLLGGEVIAWGSAKSISLTASQAYWAKIAMTNFNGSPATLTVFYPATGPQSEMVTVEVGSIQ